MVRKLTIAFIATAAIGTAALGSASTCSHITNPDTLDLRGYPIAEVEQDFDTVQRRACFRFKSLAPDLTFDPDTLCVSIDDDERQRKISRHDMPCPLNYRKPPCHCGNVGVDFVFSHVLRAIRNKPTCKKFPVVLSDRITE